MEATKPQSAGVALARNVAFASAAAPSADLKADLVSPPQGGSPTAPSQTSFHREVVRKASLSVRVKNIEQAEKQVDRLTTSVGGYVDSASSSDLASDHPKMTLALRVPVGSFDSTLDSVQSLGVRLAKTIESEDVTGQLIDYEARLRTMSAEEATYQKMLRESGNLATTENIQDKLTQIRSSIESIQSQRKTMAGLATLSTISVTLTQDGVLAAPPQDTNWLAQTWAESTTVAVNVTRLLLSILIWGAVLCPFWLPLAIAFRKLLPKTRMIGATSRAEQSSIP